MRNPFFIAMLLLAILAPACQAQPVLTVDAAPALAAWTTPEFAAFTKATGIGVNVTSSQAGADILIAPAPDPQIVEHEKLTLPYIPRKTAFIPAALKDDDGDWTALALTDLVLTQTAPPLDRAAADALRLLLLHTKGAAPAQNPALMMSLASDQAAITFPAGPSGGRETIVIPYFIARLKTGQNPQIAAQLIDFLLATPAQSRLPALAWALPARTDVNPNDDHFKIMKKLLQGVVIYIPNWHQARKSLTS
jgi:ABC-type molybdate transport system substrate-binding protein